MAGLDQLGVACPVVRRATFRLVGPVGREAASRAVDHLREPGASPAEKAWTDRVRWSGRFRRKKQMWHEMMGDVPGRILVPDPSLGGAPQVEGPTTHRLGVPCPAV